MLDGQQRLSAVLHFLTGIIPLPSNMIIDGSDISGLYAKELKQKNIKLYNKIHNYVISCKWYENISDEQASELYVEILNNTNGQYHQEIRNAISGPFADWIRDTARGYKEIGVEAHELFERVIVGKSTKLKLFSQDKKKGFKLLGRMEVDEWLSQLIYMFKHDWRNGVTQGTHTKWVKDMSRPGGDYHPKFKDKKKAENLLKFAYKIINSVPKKYKKQLNPMWAHVLILFAWEKSEHYGKIIPEKINPNNYLPFDIPGVEILIALFIITFIGWVSLSFIGKKFFEIFNNFLKRIPILRTIYSAIGQMTESLTKSDNSEKSVVLLEYPRKGIWVVGFATKENHGVIEDKINEKLINVFVPTTPNPTSGFLLMVPKKDVIYLDMNFEEASKFIVSAGTSTN